MSWNKREWTAEAVGVLCFVVFEWICLRFTFKKKNCVNWKDFLEKKIIYRNIHSTVTLIKIAPINWDFYQDHYSSSTPFFTPLTRHKEQKCTLYTHNKAFCKWNTSKACRIVIIQLRRCQLLDYTTVLD